MLYALVFTELALLIITFFLFGKDYLAPAFVAVAGLLASSVALFYNIETWQVNIGIETYVVIILGLLTFILSSLMVELLWKKKLRKTKLLKAKCFTEQPLTVINVNWIIAACYLIFSLVAITLWFSEIMKIAEHFTGESASFSEKITSYKRENLAGLPAELRISDFLGLLNSIASVGSYASLFIVLNNIISAKRFKLPELLLTLGVFISYASTIATAGRTTIVFFPIAGLIMIHMLYCSKKGWSKAFNIKFAAIFAGIIILLAVLFILLRNVVGGSFIEDPIYYLTIYLAGPIQSLDMFLKEPPPPSEIWGKECFHALNEFIATYFNKPELFYSMHKEFRDAGDVAVGNVYTCFRSYLYDFGYPGLIILSALHSAIMTFVYDFIKYAGSKHIFDFVKVLYAYLFYTIPMMFYCDWFFSFYFAPGAAKVFLLLIIMCFVLAMQPKKVYDYLKPA